MRLEQLEDRRLLAIFTVNSLADTVDANPGDGLALDAQQQTTLRAAIMEANALSGADTINLPAGTYHLTLRGTGENGGATGDLDVADGLTIVGPDASTTIIDAAGLGDRVIHLLTGTYTMDPNALELRGVTVTGGLASGTGSGFALQDYGGGLLNDYWTKVTISDCIFRNNTAPRITTGAYTGYYGIGGAICNGGSLTILDSLFDGNFASNAGGAIYVGTGGAKILIRNTTFSQNSAAQGGAVYNHEIMTIESSTFSGNHRLSGTNGAGGAINNNGGGQLTLNNCTLTGNVSGSGGGIMNYETLHVYSSTIVGNVADRGGGLYSSGSTQTFENTVISNNSGPSGGPDVYGAATSLGHNLIGDTTGSNGFGAVGDLLNVDPMLGPLADNGGATQTCALLPGSPAIDAAKTVSSPATDQRGVLRPQGAAADIGAFEAAPVANDDAYTVDEDGTLNIPSPGLLDNDADAYSDLLVATLVTSPVNGMLQLQPNGSFTYRPNPNFNGADSFTYSLSDSHGGADTATVSITVNPVQDPPCAIAGPDVTSVEVAAVMFDGSGSFDVDGDSLVYVWDFGDGVTGIGATPTHAYADNGVYTVLLTVKDGYGNSSSDTLVATVDNVAPLGDATGPLTGVRGQARTFSFTASDVSAVDQAGVFRYAIDWGDGSGVQIIDGSASISADHVFASNGSFTVLLAVADKDGGKSAQIAWTVAISAVAMQGNTLAVGGTLAGDTIVIEPAGASNGLTVTINGAVQGVFQPTERLLVYGQAGNDTVQLKQTKIKGTTRYVAVSAIIDAGSGSDTIDARGSIANNALVGSDGADTIWGGGGRDLLLGGAGADALRADNGDDILIGGTTDFDTNLAALTALLTEWGRIDLGYQARIDHLTGTTGGGWNSGYLLTPLSVHSDAAVDQLYGEQGRDWFLYDAIGLQTDLLKDLKRNESTVQIT
ncbi:MAG: Ig-like domain-containing protein [Planctomycetaceae bacterium]|nr:Ig-like domain-containing protein [Planctomycetaceae bacterium]